MFRRLLNYKPKQNIWNKIENPVKFDSTRKVWYLLGWWGEDSPTSPSRKNPDLHSSLRFSLFQGNSYTMFVILDIKFGVANIKWNLCQNTVKFQNMTSLVDKICTNIQTSMGYYLLNWVLASVCSCSQKSWILFTVSTCRAVMHSFQNLIWTANDFAVYYHKFFCLCAWQVWFYLMLSKLNPSFNFHKEDLVLSRIIR